MPPGQTTKVGRIVTGIGTEGFSAPELFARPEPSSDIYSVGRVIAWALTDKTPAPNKLLFPEPGPWRNIVRAATHDDPARRPQSVSDLVVLIERELAEIPVDHSEQLGTLLNQANHGDTSAAEAFLTLLSDNTEDFELYVEQLLLLAVRWVTVALGHSLAHAQIVLQALIEHVGGTDTRRVEYAEASRVTIWLQGLAAHAATERQWDLLDEAMQALCAWDGFWDRWDAQEIISPWLRLLKDDAAAVAAAILHDHPDSAEHFSYLADNRTVDPRICRAVHHE
ncbi:hypothetical protein ACIBMX_10065 [Streptomyces phaeochromogenes]|uniref:hypothetical protein n=1 Tax=Streptomyces phaeochromogenes TaxID=1923 RepID=UPI0033DB1582